MEDHSNESVPDILRGKILAKGHSTAAARY